MIQRLVTTVVIVLALLTAADAGQVQHPINGPSSSTPKFYPCYANNTGNQADNCANGALGYTTIQAGTAYTFATANCGTAVHFSSDSAVTATLPNTLPAGCNIDVVQDGLGQVTLSPALGAFLRSAHGFTKTFGQDAGVSLHVKSNSNGVSAIYQMFGDGA